jgi:hypothetical protein
MKKYWPSLAVTLLAFSAAAHASNISFSTFVAAGAIDTAETGTSALNGNGANSLNSTIAFTYAGNKFVGSVYFDNQLYSTNLNGGGVTLFGSALPDSSGAVGELVLGASLGLGGFANGNVFAGSGANGNIYQYANSGGAAALFATLPGVAGQVRQIFFDPGSTFGGNMLVSTTTGRIYEVNSSGAVTLLASVGEDTEGMDIASSSFGPDAGFLLVTSEGSGTLRAISPAGVVSVVATGLSGAETVSVVPPGLDLSNPLEGFYVANYPLNIQFASAGQFISQGLLGSTIVTSETGGSLAWDVAFNGSTFTVSQFNFNGNQINQFEDGIFVTPQRITDTGTAPEPSSILLLGTGLLGLGTTLKRKFVS